MAFAATLATATASGAISFSDVSAAAGVNRAGESYGASWGDLNGDGYLDIFASNHRTQTSLYPEPGQRSLLRDGGPGPHLAQPPPCRYPRRFLGRLRQRRRPGPAGQFGDRQSEPASHKRTCPPGRPYHSTWADHGKRRWASPGVAGLQRRQAPRLRDDPVRRHREAVTNRARTVFSRRRLPPRRSSARDSNTGSSTRRTGMASWTSCVPTKGFSRRRSMTPSSSHGKSCSTTRRPRTSSRS